MDPLTILIIAAGVGGAYYVDRKAKAKNTGTLPLPPPGIPPGSSGSNPPPGTPAPIPPTYTPPPVVPPPSVPVLPPGAYPAGTPGAIPLQVMVAGGDGDSIIVATPGGTVGPDAGNMSKMFWYGPGTKVIFNAQVIGTPVIGISPFTAFDHWEGPNGVSSRQNPIVLTVAGAGYVRGMFAFLGVVGR